MSKRSSFVIYDSWGKMIRNMPAEKAGELVQIMIAHAIDGEEITTDDPMISAMFAMIKDKLDEDGAKYLAKVENMKNNSKNNSERNRTEIETKSKRNRTENSGDTESVSVSDTVSVTDNESPTETKKKVKKEKAPTLTLDQMDSMIDESLLSTPLLSKIKDWVRYKQARNEPYKEMGFKSLLSQIHKYEMQDGVDAVIDVVDLSMSNDWKGIIWEKIEHHNKAQPNRGQSVDWSKV